MAQSYFQSRKLEPATFSLFIRNYPPHRGYFVCAGLEDVLRYLVAFAFDGGAPGGPPPGMAAGLKVARCSFLAGFSATSNVLAGQRYGIPIVGTMAHSFVC